MSRAARSWRLGELAERFALEAGVARGDLALQLFPAGRDLGSVVQQPLHVDVAQLGLCLLYTSRCV